MASLWDHQLEPISYRTPEILAHFHRLSVSTDVNLCCA